MLFCKWKRFLLETTVGVLYLCHGTRHRAEISFSESQSILLIIISANMRNTKKWCHPSWSIKRLEVLQEKTQFIYCQKITKNVSGSIISILDVVSIQFYLTDSWFLFWWFEGPYKWGVNPLDGIFGQWHSAHHIYRCLCITALVAILQYVWIQCVPLHMNGQRSLTYQLSDTATTTHVPERTSPSNTENENHSHETTFVSANLQVIIQPQYVQNHPSQHVHNLHQKYKAVQLCACTMPSSIRRYSCLAMIRSPTLTIPPLRTL